MTERWLDTCHVNQQHETCRCLIATIWAALSCLKSRDSWRTARLMAKNGTRCAAMAMMSHVPVFRFESAPPQSALHMRAGVWTVARDVLKQQQPVPNRCLVTALDSSERCRTVTPRMLAWSVISNPCAARVKLTRRVGIGLRQALM